MYMSIFENKAFSMRLGIGMSFTENWEIPPRTSAWFNVDFGECPVFDNLCKAITQQTNVKKNSMKAQSIADPAGGGGGQVP